MPKPYVVRTYLVALKPDPETTYHPTQVNLSFKAEDAAQMQATSPRVLSAAFQKAVEIEHDEYQTPPDREFECGGVEFVGEQELDRHELLLVPS